MGCLLLRRGFRGSVPERSPGRKTRACPDAVRRRATRLKDVLFLNFNQYGIFFLSPRARRSKGWPLSASGSTCWRRRRANPGPARWLKKSNFTAGRRGHQRLDARFTNKNLQSGSRCSAEMMKEGAGELKFFQIVTGLRDRAGRGRVLPADEGANAIREKIGRRRAELYSHPCSHSSYCLRVWLG